MIATSSFSVNCPVMKKHPILENTFAEKKGYSSVHVRGEGQSTP